MNRPDAMPSYEEETARLKALYEFLHAPIHAPKVGAKTDPEVVAALNHAVEACLQAIRAIAMDSVPYGAAR